MVKETTINRLFLMTLLLAEITRLKFKGQGMSLTNPKIERQARHTFAAMVGIPERSKPSKFLDAIKAVYNDNGMLDKFYSHLLNFKINPANYSFE